MVGCAATSLGYTLKQSKNDPYKQNNMNLGTTYFTHCALPHYEQHCSRVNHIYAIIRLCNAIILNPSTGGLAHETT